MAGGLCEICLLNLESFDINKEGILFNLEKFIERYPSFIAGSLIYQAYLLFITRPQAIILI